jgi:hypothetical protein
MSNSSISATSTFISYSWDSEGHRTWVRALAERLRADGVEANIDQWAAVPGDQLPEFMERAIAGHSFVLIVCTPRYKAKSEAREGGVGYEGDIITGELLQSRNHRKFIPVLRQGDWSISAPGWLAGKYYIDLRDGERHEAQYDDLLSTLHGTRTAAPPVGPPRVPAPSGVTAALPSGALLDAPVRIVGVIADEVSEPKNDGTRGSALYTVPFRLSKPVSHEWASVFEQVWNRPPRFTTMHRPGIAHARGNRIVLNGTTIDEVQRVHRETLILCVKETNRLMAEQEQRQRAEREHRERAAEAETVRRQLGRPFCRSAEREEQVIRLRFGVYRNLSAPKLETMKPISEVVDAAVVNLLPNTYQPSPRQVRRSSPSGRRVKKTRDRKK